MLMEREQILTCDNIGQINNCINNYFVTLATANENIMPTKLIELFGSLTNNNYSYDQFATLINKVNTNIICSHNNPTFIKTDELILWCKYLMKNHSMHYDEIIEFLFTWLQCRQEIIGYRDCIISSELVLLYACDKYLTSVISEVADDDIKMKLFKLIMMCEANKQHLSKNNVCCTMDDIQKANIHKLLEVEYFLCNLIYENSLNISEEEKASIPGNDNE
jgi:hypothetical protein